MSKKRKPCKNCPWRKDAPKGYWDRRHFLDIWKNCQDDGYTQMLCHKSPEMPENELCAGWLLVVGYDSIGARLASLKAGRDIVGDCSGKGIELYESFEEMMLAEGIDPPKRNRYLND